MIPTRRARNYLGVHELKSAHAKICDGPDASAGDACWVYGQINLRSQTTVIVRTGS